jgi:hypothetical protein
MVEFGGEMRQRIARIEVTRGRRGIRLQQLAPALLLTMQVRA